MKGEINLKRLIPIFFMRSTMKYNRGKIYNLEPINRNRK